MVKFAWHTKLLDFREENERKQQNCYLLREILHQFSLIVQTKLKLADPSHQIYARWPDHYELNQKTD